MKKNKVRIKMLRSGAAVPKYGTEFSAGADLCACVDNGVVIPAGGTAMIPTGIAAEIPSGLAGFVFARSGIASKRGLAPANKVGVIDSDYRGEILVSLHNHSSSDETVSPGERIAQIVFLPCVTAEFVVCDELEDTQRGSGGFGSTGQK